MTAAVSHLTFAAFAQDANGGIWNGMGVIVTVLLIVLLAQKELIRAHGGARSQEWMRVLDLAIWPLSVAFAVIVVVHIGTILSSR
jgi:hypothetical protein